MNDFYEPGEDSYTLFDVIQKENIKNKIVLDLGSSGGYLMTALLTNIKKEDEKIIKNYEKNVKNDKILKDHGNVIICSDININALRNNRNHNKVKTNLLEGIKIEYLDVIVFNPPYVPSEPYKIINNEYNNDKEHKNDKYCNNENCVEVEDPENLSGGNLKGNKIILEFIDSLELKGNKNKFTGVIYLLIIEANEPILICEKLEKLNFKIEIMKIRKILGERIFILKCTYKYAKSISII